MDLILNKKTFLPVFLAAMFLLSVAAITAQAQPPTQWNQTHGGTSTDIAHALHARWSRPEIGLSAGMPAVIRGGAGLLWALDDPQRESAAVRATWRALAGREDAEHPDDVVIEALSSAALTPLEELQLRAGIRQLVHGQTPSRWALEVGALDIVDETSRNSAGKGPGGNLSLRLRIVLRSRASSRPKLW